MIDYNIQLLNHNDFAHSFFQLDKSDPTTGFPFDARAYCGPTYPSKPQSHPNEPDIKLDVLELRLILGSHLAHYLRMQLEEHKGYTATVGISTSKLLAKLAGNVHKPRNQTTIVPPYGDPNQLGQVSNVTRFMDEHEIGKIPGVGFKIAHRLRTQVLGRAPRGEQYEDIPSPDCVTVGAVRSCPDMGPLLLNDILRGGGWPKDIGTKIWHLINGIDDAEVAIARTIPTQVSIEDSYGQLDTLNDVQAALLALTRSLMRRMHADLTEDEDHGEKDPTKDDPTSRRATLDGPARRRWAAHPRTLRLSTRPRLPPKPDGSRDYSSTRVSRSCPMPQFALSLSDSIETIAERLVREALIPTFRKLHPDKTGWKLSLINVAATNIVDVAGDKRTSAGRDIGKMFRTQESVLREWRVDDPVLPAANGEPRDLGEENRDTSVTELMDTNVTEFMDTDVTEFVADPETNWSHAGAHEDVSWESDEDGDMPCEQCIACSALIPHFALKAHETYHTLPD
jgi:DNA polymerase iota